MATISPYGDSRAHGSIGKALTLRRYRGRTRLSKHYNPRTTYTPGQLTQRGKFSDAIYDLNRLNDQWKKFLYDRGVSTWKHGPNLYVSAHMKNRLPSTTPGIPMDALQDIVLFNPAGLLNQSFKITIITPEPDIPCILWNKHEDSDLVSEIGVDGIPLGGVTFPAGKFGNCARIDAPYEGVKYLNIKPSMDMHSMIIHFWLNTDYSVEDGYPSDHTLHYILATDFKIDDADKWLLWVIHTTANRFYYHDNEMICANNTIDWPASEWNHFTLVIDRHATFDGDKTLAMYFNGDQIASCNGALSDWSNPTDQKLWLGCNHIETSPVGGMMDNPKIVSPVSPEALEAVLANKDNEDMPGPESLGHIYDSENVFTQGDPLLPGTAAIIRIENVSGDPERIPFDYPLTLHWFRDPDQEGTARIKLPRLDMPAETYVDLYIATDGSVYWNEGMTQLACTPKMYYAKTE